jgi:hypothetical protein
MASNGQDENLKVTITDVPASGSTDPTTSDANSTAAPSTAAETAKVVDVDENLTTGSLNVGYSSWWGSLIQTAKEKTKTAMELIKTDFDEFKTTMATDTNQLLTQITSINIADNLNPILTNLNKTFSVSEDDGQGGFGRRQDESDKPTASGSSSIYDRYLNELKSLQSNQNTYLSDPNDEQAFVDFRDNFDSNSYKSDISDLLIENSAMRLLYSQLVIFFTLGSIFLMIGFILILAKCVNIYFKNNQKDVFYFESFIQIALS